MRINERQMRRPERLPDIAGIANNRIPHADGKRKRVLHGVHCPCGLLRSHGDESAGCAQGEQGKLLGYQPGKTSLWEGAPFQPVFGQGGAVIWRIEGTRMTWDRHPPQRPVIPKQQHKWKGDDLRFGHRSEERRVGKEGKSRWSAY